MFRHEQALASLDNQLGARSLGHVSFELLFLVQVAMAVRVRVWIRLPVRQGGQQVLLIVVRTKAALLLLQRVDLITKHCEMLHQIIKAYCLENKTKHTPGAA